MTRTLDYQKPVRSGAALRTSAAVLLAIAWIWSLTGLLLVVGHHLLPRATRFPVLGIHTIMLTGPVLELIGVAALTTAIFTRSGRLIAAAVAPVAFPILIFLLINILEWGPTDADQPVTVLIVIYILLSLPLTAVACWKR